MHHRQGGLLLTRPAELTHLLRGPERLQPFLLQGFATQAAMVSTGTPASCCSRPRRAGKTPREGGFPRGDQRSGEGKWVRPAYAPGTAGALPASAASWLVLPSARVRARDAGAGAARPQTTADARSFRRGFHAQRDAAGVARAPAGLDLDLLSHDLGPEKVMLYNHRGKGYRSDANTSNKARRSCAAASGATSLRCILFWRNTEFAIRRESACGGSESREVVGKACVLQERDVQHVPQGVADMAHVGRRGTLLQVCARTAGVHSPSGQVPGNSARPHESLTV